MNMVVNGEVNPFYEWTKAYPHLYLCGEGPEPETVLAPV